MSVYVLILIRRFIIKTYKITCKYANKEIDGYRDRLMDSQTFEEINIEMEGNRKFSKRET